MPFFNISYNKNRILGLDLMRGIPMLNLIYAHGVLIAKNFVNDKAYIFFAFDGVTLFFVLSGFLVGTILIKTLEKGELGWRNILDFWIRRWMRTLPNYYLVLTFLLILWTLIFKENFFKYINYYFFCQNLWYENPKFFPDSWSLPVEEWFYLFIPLLSFIMVATKKIKPKTAILFLSISTIIISLVFRWIRHSHIPQVDNFESWDLTYRKQVITRLDSIMYGVLIAYFKFYAKSIWEYKKKLLFIIAILLFAFDTYYLYCCSNGYLNLHFGWYTDVLSLSISSIAAMFMIPYLYTIKHKDGWFYKFITFTSIISYSIYLLNLNFVQMIFLPIFMAVAAKLLPRFLEIYFHYIAYWFFTFFFATLLYKFFESKVIDWRDKIDLKVKHQNVLD
ncbi:MAG: acyltransferase [Chitinophagales bacterium]|nr:acyltransferase [Chitinophagales bacterium]